jgi:hypothetical protein
MQDSRCKIQDAKFEIRNSGFQIQNSDHEQSKNPKSKIQNSSDSSHLIAFGLCPFYCPVDDEVVVKGGSHHRNPELAVSKIHHEGQKNIHQRVFPGLAREGNDKL